MSRRGRGSFVRTFSTLLAGHRPAPPLPFSVPRRGYSQGLSSSSSHVRLAGWWTNPGVRGGDRLTSATSKMDTSAMRTKARANVAFPRGTNRARRLVKKNESRIFGTTPSRRETAGCSRGKERSTWSTGLQATSDCNGVSEGSYQTAVDVVRASARTRWKIGCESRSCRNLVVEKRGAVYSLLLPCRRC